MIIHREMCKEMQTPWLISGSVSRWVTTHYAAQKTCVNKVREKPGWRQSGRHSRLLIRLIKLVRHVVHRSKWKLFSLLFLHLDLKRFLAGKAKGGKYKILKSERSVSLMSSTFANTAVKTNKRKIFKLSGWQVIFIIVINLTI